MFLVVAFTRFLEGRFTFVQKISSAVVCTLLGIALGNLGVIPHTSAVGAGISAYAVPYAIVLVILSSRLSDLKKAGAPLVFCFLLGGAGTFVGAVTASFAFASAFGPETWKLGGTFAGAFWGGGLNFAAVGNGLEMSESLFTAAFVVDNLSTVPWMLTQMGLFALLAPYYRKFEEAGGSEPVEDVRKAWTSTSISITDLALLAAIPLAALWLSEQLSPLTPSFPPVLWLTTMALILAQFPPVQKLKGAAVLSYFALHLFFIVIGAGSSVREVLRAGPSLFAYMILIIVVHALVVYGVGWLLRFDLQRLTLASQAAIGGPGSVLALGMAMKWRTLVTPGIIVGIFGYGLGNYLGFATAYWLQGRL